ncbi:MAG: hypothetical protein JWM34_5256 [Ilumatobacteraceae bacterium]|nr:hypothetical protein [Ilumatobacteraceae bacterium]
MATDHESDGTARDTGATDPLHRILELVVYAPIGLLALAKDELPGLIATGKTRVDNQLTVAKFIGKMAVTQGKQEVERRLDAAEQARRAPAEPMPIVDAEPAVDLSTASLPEAVIELVAESPLLDDTHAALPIDGYDSLAASQVVGRLGSLTEVELAAVERYETTHRARRTILGKINQLQAG